METIVPDDHSNAKSSIAEAVNESSIGQKEGKTHEGSCNGTNTQYFITKYTNINKVVLFGSRARGDHTLNSDYDIAIFSNAMEHVEQSKFLSDIDGIRTLNKIDVVFIMERHVDREFYKNIMKDGVTVMDKFQTKLENYKNVLARLQESIAESEKFADNLTFRDSAIQRFEFTSELAWKTIREYLLSEKVADINSPKSVMREPYHMNIISDEDG